jgi:DNA-binding NarL/FixJ family response regulator
MTNKMTALIIDASSGETWVEELTAKQLEERLEQESKELAIQNELQAKESARTSALAKLAALGLTEEEIAAL